MYFSKKPAKADVKNKLFDLLRDDFTLRTAEEEDDYVKRKEIQEKNVYKRVILSRFTKATKDCKKHTFKILSTSRLN